MKSEEANDGNFSRLSYTCFISSVLEVLYNLTEFRKLIIEQYATSTDVILLTVSRAFKLLEDNPTKSVRTDTMLEFLENSKYSASLTFNVGSGGESADFLMYLMNHVPDMNKLVMLDSDGGITGWSEVNRDDSGFYKYYGEVDDFDYLIFLAPRNSNETIEDIYMEHGLYTCYISAVLEVLFRSKELRTILIEQCATSNNVILISFSKAFRLLEEYPGKSIRMATIFEFLLNEKYNQSLTFNFGSGRESSQLLIHLINNVTGLKKKIHLRKNGEMVEWAQVKRMDDGFYRYEGEIGSYDYLIFLAPRNSNEFIEDIYLEHEPTGYKFSLTGFTIRTTESRSDHSSVFVKQNDAWVRVSSGKIHPVDTDLDFPSGLWSLWKINEETKD